MILGVEVSVGDPDQGARPLYAIAEDRRQLLRLAPLRLSVSGNGKSVRGILLPILLLLLAAPLGAQQRKPIDYALAASTTGLIVVDWSQTVHFHEYPNKGELNPLLGKHPSEGRVNLLLSLATLTNLGGLRLPPVSRRCWYVAVLVGETWAVAHNARLGWRIGF